MSHVVCFNMLFQIIFGWFLDELLVTSERSEQSSYYQSYIDRLDDIHTAIKSLKKWDKIKIIFFIILGLAKSYKKMNRPDPTGRFLTAYFSEGFKDRDVTFWNNLALSLQFVQIKFGINIYLLLYGKYAPFGNVTISVIFISFFINTFDWKGNFKLWSTKLESTLF